MKKGLILAAALFASTALFAQFDAGQQGGFTGPSIAPTTILKAKELKDDTNVILEGQIIKRMGKDKYLFKDATGEIVVEIDNRDWNGVKVAPEDIVIIYGEVDKDWNSIEIDVDKITKK